MELTNGESNPLHFKSEKKVRQFWLRMQRSGWPRLEILQCWTDSCKVFRTQRKPADQIQFFRILMFADPHGIVCTNIATDNRSCTGEMGKSISTGQTLPPLCSMCLPHFVAKHRSTRHWLHWREFVSLKQAQGSSVVVFHSAHFNMTRDPDKNGGSHPVPTSSFTDG